MVAINGVELYQAQESERASEANVNVTSIPMEAAEDQIVTALERQKSPSLSGTATGIRLSGLSGYSSDPQTALAEWVQQFESLCNEAQGSGWTLTDDERNDSIQVVVSEASWTRVETGAPLEVAWTLQCEVGEGVLTDQARSPTSATPNSAETLDGTDLGSIDEKRTATTVEMEVFPIALGDASDTILIPEGGQVREVTISGRVGGSKSELRSFDDTMDALVGGNTQATYQTAFPGTTHEVVVGGYASTFAAGDPHTLRYTLTLHEGLTLHGGQSGVQ